MTCFGQQDVVEVTVASSKPMTQGALYASLSRSLSLSASELCHHHKPSQSAGGQGTDGGKHVGPGQLAHNSLQTQVSLAELCYAQPRSAELSS